LYAPEDSGVGDATQGDRLLLLVVLLVVVLLLEKSHPGKHAETGCEGENG